jgi:hypothetical protein
MCGDAVLVGQWVGAEAGFDEKEQVLWIAKRPTRETISLRLGKQDCTIRKG